jgi:hypothetical protein
MERSDSSRPFPRPRLTRLEVLLREGLFALNGGALDATRSARSGSPLDLRGVFGTEAGGLPGSWTSLGHVPRSSTPVGPPRPTTRRFGVVFHAYQHVDSHKLSFGAPSRGPCPACVRFTPSVTRRGATRGSGWWSALSGRDFHPQGCNEDFDVYFISPPLQAWPGARQETLGLPGVWPETLRRVTGFSRAAQADAEVAVLMGRACFERAKAALEPAAHARVRTDRETCGTRFRQRTQQAVRARRGPALRARER